MSAPAIEFARTEAERGGHHVLGPLDLAIDVGEVVVLLGRSGSGKTTMLRLANRLLEPVAGAVHVLGRPTSAWDAVQLRRSIGYVIQEGGLFPHLTIAANVGIVPKLVGWTSQRTTERSNTLLDLVGLPPTQFADRYPHALSGGQRQRVGVARALAADPPILVCDEPFGALDPITRAELQREFATLVAQMEKTVLFVTHDVGEALMLADRIVLLEHGHAEFIGSPDAFRTSDHPLVAEFRTLL